MGDKAREAAGILCPAVKAETQAWEHHGESLDGWVPAIRPTPTIGYAVRVCSCSTMFEPGGVYQNATGEFRVIETCQVGEMRSNGQHHTWEISHVYWRNAEGQRRTTRAQTWVKWHTDGSAWLVAMMPEAHEGLAHPQRHGIVNVKPRSVRAVIANHLMVVAKDEAKMETIRASLPRDIDSLTEALKDPSPLVRYVAAQMTLELIE